MKHNWLNNFIRNARKIELTPEEKSRMLFSIMGKSLDIKTLIHSPYSFVSILSKQVVANNKRVVAFTLIIALILMGGGTSYAAESSLPGEPLYPIKVNFNEEIQNFVAVTPNARVKVEVQHTESRLSEAEQLSKTGKLNAETQAIITTGIKKHTKSIKDNIAALASENDATATVQAVVSDLKTSIQVHEAAFNTLASSTAATSTEIDPLQSTVNTVKSELADIENSVNGSTTATTTATSTLPTGTATTTPNLTSTGTTTASTTNPNATTSTASTTPLTDEERLRISASSSTSTIDIQGLGTTSATIILTPKK